MNIEEAIKKFNEIFPELKNIELSKFDIENIINGLEAGNYAKSHCIMMANNLAKNKENDDEIKI